jgi:N-ethylmaleimide reductase
MDHIQRAARIARAAGFDGIELDAAAGSLAECFLRPQTNSRDDGYGGDDERRMRFLLEAAHVIAEEFSSERVGVRLSPRARQGQKEVLAGVMRAVSEREMAYVHLAHVEAPSTKAPDGPSPMAACAERQMFRSDVSCALVVTDHCDVDLAMRAVDSRWADAVGFLQANDDPGFVGRLLGQEQRSGRTP